MLLFWTTFEACFFTPGMECCVTLCDVLFKQVCNDVGAYGLKTEPAFCMFLES